MPSPTEKRSSPNGFIQLMNRLRGKRETFEEEDKLFKTEDPFQDRRSKSKTDRRLKRQKPAIPKAGDRRKKDRRHTKKTSFNHKGDWYLKASIETEDDSQT